MGEAINELVKRVISKPNRIGRDHLDTGSVASPFREIEGMKMVPTQLRLADIECTA